MRRLLLALALLGAVATGAGIAYSAIPGSDGSVRFCYKAVDAAKQGGASVTVIDRDAGGSCKSGQAESSVLDQALVTGSSAGPGGSGFQTPNTNGFEARVTTSKPTKLFIIGTLNLQGRCNSATAPCGITAFLHVDGEQIRSTFRSMSASGQVETRTAFAVVDVAAGEHVVEWRTGGFGEFDVLGASIAPWVAAVALGG
jgi:hypothetical protein